jgi:ATP-dependent DNA helicase RecG
MRRLLSETNLAPPTFESDRGRDEFVATFFLHNLLDDEDLAWVAHFADLDLTSDETKALVHVREAGQITNAVYRDLNGVDTLEASSHLRRLRDLKLLQQHDRGAATFYTPTRRCRNPTSDPGDESGDLEEQSGDLAEQSDNLGEKSGDLGRQNGRSNRQSGELSQQSGELSQQSGDLPMHSGRPVLPPELARAVDQLNLWTPQPELRRLIQRLCAWRPLSANELSLILQRSKTYLRTSYIGPMVQAGELAYTNPEKPNAPGQKYRSGQALRDE